MSFFIHRGVCVDLVKLFELSEETLEVDFTPTTEEVKDALQHYSTSNPSSLNQIPPLLRPDGLSQSFEHIFGWLSTDDIIVLMPLS